MRRALSTLLFVMLFGGCASAPVVLQVDPPTPEIDATTPHVVEIVVTDSSTGLMVMHAEVTVVGVEQTLLFKSPAVRIVTDGGAILLRVEAAGYAPQQRLVLPGVHRIRLYRVGFAD